MSFRSSLGRDLSSSLESSYHEMPVDRIAAFSRAGRLGTLLWRLKYGHDPAAWRRTVNLLAVDAGIPTDQGRRLCGMVIREWLDPNCPDCNGARELIAGDRRIVCPRCEGLGLRRYSDHARARFMGIPVAHWRALSGLYSRVLERLTHAERQVSATMHIELER